MTAPMVVANWINMQYYGSVVDNRRFGSGNKVLHNVVGGALGVLEGNSGDLRTGLSMQSLHDGTRWVHEPLRLSVFLEAPEIAIDDIIARHDHRAYRELSGKSGEDSRIDGLPYEAMPNAKVCPVCNTLIRLTTQGGDRAFDDDCYCENCNTRLAFGMEKLTKLTPQDNFTRQSRGRSTSLVRRDGTQAWDIEGVSNRGGAAKAGGGCLFGFAVIWEGFTIFWTIGVAQAPDAFKFMALFFSIPFHLVGLALLALTLYIFFGRFRLYLSTGESFARWSIGPLGYTRRFHYESVTEVKLTKGAIIENANRNRSQAARSQEQFSCVIVAAGKKIPVTNGSDLDQARKAVGVIRYCLEDLGLRLEDD